MNMKTGQREWIRTDVPDLLGENEENEDGWENVSGLH